MYSGLCGTYICGPSYPTIISAAVYRVCLVPHMEPRDCPRCTIFLIKLTKRGQEQPHCGNQYAAAIVLWNVHCGIRRPSYFIFRANTASDPRPFHELQEGAQSWNITSISSRPCTLQHARPPAILL